MTPQIRQLLDDAEMLATAPCDHPGTCRPTAYCLTCWARLQLRYISYWNRARIEVRRAARLFGGAPPGVSGTDDPSP